MGQKEEDDRQLDAIAADAERRRVQAELEAQPPPAPKPEPIGLGYWYLDGRYGDFFAEARKQINVYHCWWQRGFWRDSEQPYDGPDGWVHVARGLTRRAHDAGLRIVLNVGFGEPGVPGPDEVLKTLGSFWDKVWLVDLFDEPNDWTRDQTNRNVDAWRKIVQQHGLEPRPVGITIQHDHALTDACVTAENLDFLSLETYREASEQGDAAGNIVQRMKADARRAYERFHGKILLVGQGYDRNGNWKNEDTLFALQHPTYDVMRELKDRALGITWFAYGRPGGTHDHPRLRAVHKIIAQEAGLF